jgi:hypothetical protein
MPTGLRAHPLLWGRRQAPEFHVCVFDMFSDFYISCGGFPLCHIMGDIRLRSIFCLLARNYFLVISIRNFSSNPRRFYVVMVVEYLSNCSIDRSRLGERASKARMSEHALDVDGP